MKYKVGDKVKVRSDLMLGKTYYSENGARDGVTDKMLLHKGQVVTISRTDAGAYGKSYRIIECDGYNWTDEMFECLAEPARIKAYDLMKLAAENPQEYEGRKYNVVDGAVEWCIQGATPKFYSTIAVSSSGNLVGVDDKGDKTYDVVSICNYTILEEIPPEPKPVPFMDAVKAYGEGKTIRCKCGFSTATYYPTKSKLLSSLGYRVTSGGLDVGGLDIAVTTKEILEGQWYIK